MGRVRGAHVHVPFMPDHAGRQLDHAGGTEQIAAGRIAMVTALAHRDVHPQRDGVGEGQLDLAVIAAGPQDAQARDHAAAGADDRHGFLGGEETVLVKRLVGRQLVADAEQAFEISLGYMAVPGRDVHDQLWGAGPGVRPHLAIRRQAMPQGVTHEPFDHAPVQRCRAHG